MGKCKNCGEETKKKNVYCSLKCRNIYVNKNLRDYSKCSETHKKKHIKIYDSDPNYCETCGEKIPYKIKDNKYCCKKCIPYNYKNRKGMKYNYSKEGLKSIRDANKKRDYEKKKEYYSNIKRCLCCNRMLPFNKRKNIYCDKDCKTEFFRKNRTEIENYKKDCKFKFNLKDYNNEFDFTLIEKYGWYKAKNRGNNLDGVSRDHMYSVMEGFRNNIDVEIISHPANCKLMSHTKNISKNDKCSISLEDLKEKIEKWDLKYNK